VEDLSNLLEYLKVLRKSIRIKTFRGELETNDSEKLSLGL